MLVNGSAAQLERWISVQAAIASHHPATFWESDWTYSSLSALMARLYAHQKIMSSVIAIIT